MKVFINPQINNAQSTKYLFMGDSIKVCFYRLIEYKKVIEDSSGGGEQDSNPPQFEIIQEEELIKTTYFDLSNIKEGRGYQVVHPIVRAVREDGELKVELINYIKDDASDEEVEAVWIEPIDADEDEFGEGEFIQFREREAPVVVDPLTQMRAENKALELRVEQMKNQLEEDRRINEATTLEVLELMMSML